MDARRLLALSAVLTHKPSIIKTFWVTVSHNPLEEPTCQRLVLQSSSWRLSRWLCAGSRTSRYTQSNSSPETRGQGVHDHVGRRRTAAVENGAPNSAEPASSTPAGAASTDSKRPINLGIPQGPFDPVLTQLPPLGRSLPPTNHRANNPAGEDVSIVQSECSIATRGDTDRGRLERRYRLRRPRPDRQRLRLFGRPGPDLGRWRVRAERRERGRLWRSDRHRDELRALGLRLPGPREPGRARDQPRSLPQRHAHLGAVGQVR